MDKQTQMLQNLVKAEQDQATTMKAVLKKLADMNKTLDRLTAALETIAKCYNLSEVIFSTTEELIVEEEVEEKC